MRRGRLVLLAGEFLALYLGALSLFWLFAFFFRFILQVDDMLW